MGYIQDLELLDLAAAFKGDFKESIKNVEMVLDELTEKYEQSMDGLNINYGKHLINLIKQIYFKQDFRSLTYFSDTMDPDFDYSAVQAITNDENLENFMRRLGALSNQAHVENQGKQNSNIQKTQQYSVESKCED